MREYLKRLREARGFSQQEMANKIGISKQYYSLIENGERQRKMDITLVSAIASICCIPVEQIIEAESALVTATHNTHEIKA